MWVCYDYGTGAGGLVCDDHFLLKVPRLSFTSPEKILVGKEKKWEVGILLLKFSYGRIKALDAVFIHVELQVSLLILWTILALLLQVQPLTIIIRFAITSVRSRGAKAIPSLACM